MIKFISWIFTLILTTLIVGLFIGVGIFYYFGSGLPDYKTLADYEPPVVSRLYANDGQLFAEYAHEKRIYIPYQAIPSKLKEAFLSAEDKNFYTHFGIDIPSILSAVIVNIQRLGSSRRPHGASTITQQVAKNFLLSDVSAKVSYERKIKEAILSFRIENAYSKEYILELYLNEVFLGNRSYGVAAAALNYFNKSLEKLSIGEMAYLASLPKAPSRYNPIKRPKLTYARRNWVIDQMQENGFITQSEAQEAKNESIHFQAREITKSIEGSYFAEEVRRELINTYGNQAVYQNGYYVRTTLNPKLQSLAEKTLQEGLETYDRNHGWRGPITHLPIKTDKITPSAVEQEDLFLAHLRSVTPPPGTNGRLLALVIDVTPQDATILVSDATRGKVPLTELTWARRYINAGTRGPVIKKASDVLKVGDVVLVEKITQKPKETSPKLKTSQEMYKLCQIPKVSGALVAMEPHTGRVLAMQGGYSFSMSQFNRATQALRQTGSAFKPFVYLAAFESGLTPSSLLEDVPFAIDIGYDQGVWRPNNWDKKFMGELTVRRSFELSRNVAAIRMIHEIVGMKNVVDVAKRLNIDRHMPPQLSGILGASETTVLRLCAAYAMIGNGGRLVVPTFFDHIQDRRGKTILTNNYILCQGCDTKDPYTLPQLIDHRPWVTDPIAAYQLTSLLRGVVERGTGKSLAKIPHSIAAKSGTTNDYRDAWMVGFSPTLVVAVYVGFDEPNTLGPNSYGAKVAAPIFESFMSQALADQLPLPFKVPQGVSLVRVNPLTGARARLDDQNVIYEAFRPGTEIQPFHDELNHPKLDSKSPYMDSDMPLSDAEEYPDTPTNYRIDEAPDAFDKNYPQSKTQDQGTNMPHAPVYGTGGLY